MQHADTIAKLDALWALKVKTRDGYVCQQCGGMASDAAHVYGRKNMRLRFDPLNGIALCRSCHRYFTDHNDEWYAWVEKWFPKRWAYLTERKNELVRVNILYLDECLKLLQ